jgi:hypothetical protein
VALSATSSLLPLVVGSDVTGMGGMVALTATSCLLPLVVGSDVTGMGGMVAHTATSCLLPLVAGSEVTGMGGMVENCFLHGARNLLTKDNLSFFPDFIFLPSLEMALRVARGFRTKLEELLQVAGRF